MKLYHSPASPFVRKVNAVAIHHGIELDRVPTNPHESPAELLGDNPLSKVPCLVTDDGVALPDSPIICEYLDSIGTNAKLLPEHGAPRWHVLRVVALADGTIDCIATDHAPHTPDAKEQPFDEAPPGMLGLETALGLALTELDLEIEDAADEDAFNRVLWETIKGERVPYPGARRMSVLEAKRGM